MQEYNLAGRHDVTLDAGPSPLVRLCQKREKRFTPSNMSETQRSSSRGPWGAAAWENDGAADWFGDTFDATGLAKRVEETLNGDPEDEYEEIRAAAHMLVALGQTFIWPVDDLDRHLALAIDKLEVVRKLEIYEDAPEITEAIGRDIEVLRSRLAPPPDDQ